MRNLVRETNLTAHDFVLPLFVSAKIDKEKPIASMPGVSQFSPNEIAEEAKRAHDLGLQAVLLFGVCPLIFDFSRHVMLEMPTLMWGLIATFHFVRFLDESRRRDVFIAAVACGLLVYPVGKMMKGVRAGDR